MARFATPPSPPPLPAPGTRFEIEWGTRKAPLREGYRPGRVVGVAPDGRRTCVLLTAVREEFVAAYAADIERLSRHSTAEQGRLIEVLRYSAAHQGNEVPEPQPAAPAGAPQQTNLFD